MIRGGSEPSIENADLSIIMPVYNTEETYLRACLSSIEACVAEGICIDVVIVDDGSTFDYCKSLNAIASSYSFGARVLKKSNGGQNSARAYGLARAKGKYVLFADSDDRLVPSELKRVLDAALAHLPKILCFNFDRVNPDGSLIAHCDPWQVGYRKIESLSRIIPESDSLFRQLYYRESIIGSGVSLVEGARIGEDMASAVALLLSIGEAASIEATPYLYVQRPTSALHSVSKDRVLDIISSVEGMLARIPYKARSEYHQELESLCIEHLLFWGGVRAIDVSDAAASVKSCVFSWMDERFPNWRANACLNSLAAKHGWRLRLIVSGHWRIYKALSAAGKLKRSLRLSERGQEYEGAVCRKSCVRVRR